MMTLAAAQIDSRLIVACLLLMGAIMVMGIGVWLYRRYALARDKATGPSTGWSLDDLAELRRQGRITEEEYRSMRAVLIAAYAGEKPSGDRPLPPRPREEEWDWVAPEPPVLPNGPTPPANSDFDVKEPPAG